jgi:RimJ/RimL family protein N-acetyltransferase
LLEGKTVNLRVWEKDDVDYLVERINDIDFWGEYNPIDGWYEGQMSKSELTKMLDNPSGTAALIEFKRFMIQRKDGTKIGFIAHFLNQPYKLMEIAYNIVPSERGKGYGTEATQLIVDYLFLSKNINRIQATTNVGNKASQRVLEKTGFKIEGTIRKLQIVRGVWADYYLLSILRDEWKEPKILTKTK